MGLDYNGVKCLLYAHALGVSFAKTITLGRQGLHLHPRDLKEAFEELHHNITDETLEKFFHNSDSYSEEFLRFLGATAVHSIDFSNYEGASYVHDMNKPIPDDYKNRFTVVLDGGTLEHVFNFPVAIKNCMEMLEVGGHYLGITPANNFMGHGFYQFSPELYFRLFSEENGYKVIRIILFENQPYARWYSVKDPEVVSRRVTLSGGAPAFFFVTAKRIDTRAIFVNAPQQSDYVPIWTKGNLIDGIVKEQDKMRQHIPKKYHSYSMKKHMTYSRISRCLRALMARSVIGMRIKMLINSYQLFDTRFYEPINLSKELLEGDNSLGLNGNKIEPR